MEMIFFHVTAGDDGMHFTLQQCDRKITTFSIHGYTQTFKDKKKPPGSTGGSFYFRL